MDCCTEFKVCVDFCVRCPLGTVCGPINIYPVTRELRAQKHVGPNGKCLRLLSVLTKVTLYYHIQLNYYIQISLKVVLPFQIVS